MALRYLIPGLILTLFSCLTAGAQTKYAVKVTNLGNKTGKLYIGWYGNAGTFMKRDKTVFAKVVPVSGKSEVLVEFDRIPAGKYAISVFLDENGNGELDTNLVGIPREKYGFSNNVLPAMRAATYEEAVFEVKDAPGNLSIKLK
ncbi:DUF2141 domain-containing protein [Chitinophaga lutea]|uniref:DUF2141 domain-containing protein n=1 Tax=Chitinophaga lutea TaxID=2488634 RepID=A0A3N4PL83_9BACT|nr:DUF2141 domain-containing protein [Chitinophaga lutea]RPE08318.1 DUF2141 domain-containing protein [Chitinophaga lutea]